MVAARDAGPGPHLTPVVAVWSDRAIWITTARGSTKVRTWARDPRTAGVVRGPDGAVIFRGRVRIYDVLDPMTWWDAAVDAPVLARASARFVARHARAFVGYAIDARHVPLAWTPPGRVLARIEPDPAIAVGPEGRLVEPVPALDLAGPPRYRSASRRPGGPLAGVPTPVLAGIGARGDAVLGIDAPSGPVAVPARWGIDDREVWAAVALEVLAAAGIGPEFPAAASLCVDAGGSWRARSTTGVLVRGAAAAFVPRGLTSGAASAARRIEAAGGDAERSALVRLTPRRIVWWAGWDSGTVRR